MFTQYSNFTWAMAGAYLNTARSVGFNMAYLYSKVGIKKQLGLMIKQQSKKTMEYQEYLEN